MTTIHILGSEGFIGRALQIEAGKYHTHCWSHRNSHQNHYFDLLDRSTWEPLLRSQPTHAILLSWPGLPNYQEAFHVSRNLPACLELIEQLVRSGLQHLVVSGTCYEYGLQNGPLKEDQRTDPINSYAIGKDSLRRFIANHYTRQKLRWCWARIFYPFGKGQAPNCFLPSLELAIVRGDAYFAMGSGSQIRDYLPIEDVARHILQLAINPCASGIYNIGSGVPRSMLEVAQLLINTYETNIKLLIGARPDRSDEPLAFWADIKKLNQLYHD